MTIKIGFVEIPTRILLAPMAGCTDLPFRLIARKHGAKFCFFEMVDCNSITYGQKRTVRSILKSCPADTPIAAQILGRDPDAMLKGAEEMLGITKASFLDVNAACPAKKVVKKHAGSYLLNDEPELQRILKKLSGALDIPVTVKLRTGYLKPDTKKIASLAKKCEDSGAAAIFIHGRTRAQGYTGEIDYESIKAVKDTVNIPVFGSGNIFTPESAKSMLDRTGCDGILVARGSLGNPWLIKQIEKFLDTGRIEEPVDLSSRKAIVKKHLTYVEEFLELKPSSKIGHMRKTVIWYMKYFPNASKIRQKASLVTSYENMIELIDSL
ncbi:MAG: tRNA dihydrouridine synthase DusB [Candidatus Omnitrophota bacterium]